MFGSYHYVRLVFTKKMESKRDDAIDVLEMAQKKGFAKAFSLCGALLCNPDDDFVNPGEAIYYFSKAVELGDEGSRETVESLSSAYEMTPPSKRKSLRQLFGHSSVKNVSSYQNQYYQYQQNQYYQNQQSPYCQYQQNQYYQNQQSSYYQYQQNQYYQNQQNDEQISKVKNNSSSKSHPMNRGQSNNEVTSKCCILI